MTEINREFEPWLPFSLETTTGAPTASTAGPPMEVSGTTWSGTTSPPPWTSALPSMLLLYSSPNPSHRLDQEGRRHHCQRGQSVAQHPPRKEQRQLPGGRCYQLLLSQCQSLPWSSVWTLFLLLPCMNQLGKRPGDLWWRSLFDLHDWWCLHSRYSSMIFKLSCHGVRSTRASTTRSLLVPSTSLYGLFGLEGGNRPTAVLKRSVTPSLSTLQSMKQPADPWLDMTFTIRSSLNSKLKLVASRSSKSCPPIRKYPVDPAIQ